MEQKLLQKIARMNIYQIPQNQIAAACGVSDSYISQILETAEYKQIEESVAMEKYEEQELVNQGWDAVEALGIKRVVEVLRHNPDEDFALRAAAIANKAVRRGSHRQNPIPQSAGVRAVINLRPIFVDKLQNNFELSGDRLKQLANNKKDSNFLAPDKVQDLLSIDVETNQKIEFDSNTPVTSSESDEIALALKDFEIQTL